MTDNTIDTAEWTAFFPDLIPDFREALLHRTNGLLHNHQLIDVLGVGPWQFFPPRPGHLGREPAGDEWKCEAQWTPFPRPA